MNNEKAILVCRKCGTPFHFPKKRNWIGQNILFFLPIKRFFCARCLADRYVWLTEKDYKEKYQRVL